MCAKKNARDSKRQMTWSMKLLCFSGYILPMKNTYRLNSHGATDNRSAKSYTKPGAEQVSAYSYLLSLARLKAREYILVKGKRKDSKREAKPVREGSQHLCVLGNIQVHFGQHGDA